MPALPVNIQGGSAVDQQRIRDTYIIAGSRLSSITDLKLREKIRRRMFLASVFIHTECPPYLYGWNNWITLFGFKFAAEEEIHICIKNIPDNNLLADVLLHEWAHSCCWQHGDGGGVPIDSGFHRGHIRDREGHK